MMTQKNSKIKIELTSSDAWLIRDAIAFSIRYRSSTLSKAKQKRLVNIAEHVLLKELINPPKKKKTSKRPRNLYPQSPGAYDVYNNPGDDWSIGREDLPIG